MYGVESSEAILHIVTTLLGSLFMYLNCTAYNVRRTLYIVRHTMCNVHRAMYIIRRTMYIVRHTMCNVRRALYIIRRTVYNVRHAICNVRHALYGVYISLKPHVYSSISIKKL